MLPRALRNVLGGRKGGCGRVLITAIAMTLLCSAYSSPIDEDSLQDIAFSLQNPEASGNSMENRHLQQQLRTVLEMAQRTGQDLDDPESPFHARLMEILAQHELQARADKRASYMSLCHFKICNMGRKRAPWNMWQRA